MKRATLMLLLALCACTEPTRSARDGSVAVPDCAAEPEADTCDPASAQGVMFSWADSLCGLLLGCCATSDRTGTAALLVGKENLGLLMLREPTMLEDRRACQRAFALSLFTRYQTNYRSWDEGRQGFDRAAARECLSHFERGAAACAPGLILRDEAHQPKACGQLFTPRVPEDGGCADDGDCLEAPDGGRSVCQSRSALRDDGGIFFALTGSCRPLPDLGQACPLPDGDCGADRFCAPDARCRDRAHVDEPCVASPCDSQTFCDTAPPLPTCVPRRLTFGPCTSQAQCAVGATCHSELLVCMGVPDVSPLDIEFDFCLGDGGVAVARVLIPDGGVP